MRLHWIAEFVCGFAIALLPACDAGDALPTTQVQTFAGAAANAQALDSPLAKASTDDAARREAAQRELAARLGPLLRRDATAVEIEVDGHGRTHVDLQGGFGHALVARRTDGGQLAIECVDNLKEAERFFGLQPATTPGTVTR